MNVDIELELDDDVILSMANAGMAEVMKELETRIPSPKVNDEYPDYMRQFTITSRDMQMLVNIGIVKALTEEVNPASEKTLFERHRQ